MANANTKIIIQTVSATLAVSAIAALLTGYLILISGIYNVASTSQHLQFVHSILEQGMQYSVRLHARKIVVPPLDDRQLVVLGASLYRDNCVECHGAPGVAPRGIGMGMQPVPGPLVDAASKWDAGQMYWIVRHGIKMSGMPAWEYRMQDEELWQLVAFLQQMPQLSPTDYQAVTTEQGVKK